MQNYQDVCGTESRVWFEIRPKEGKEFLHWAKSLGCVWLNGEEIVQKKGADFFHFAIHSDGTLANVAMYAWVSPFVFQSGDFRHSKKTPPTARLFAVRGVLSLSVYPYILSTPYK